MTIETFATRFLAETRDLFSDLDIKSITLCTVLGASISFATDSAFAEAVARLQLSGRAVTLEPFRVVTSERRHWPHTVIAVEGLRVELNGPMVDEAA